MFEAQLLQLPMHRLVELRRLVLRGPTLGAALGEAAPEDARGLVLQVVDAEVVDEWGKRMEMGNLWICQKEEIKHVPKRLFSKGKNCKNRPKMAKVR